MTQWSKKPDADAGAAADHRGERLRAALEVDQLDLDAGLFVFAELLGQHGGQIAEAGGAADRDGDLLRDCRAGHQRQRAKRRQHGSDGFAHWNVLLLYEISATP